MSDSARPAMRDILSLSSNSGAGNTGTADFTEKDFYKETREHIKHEDLLIHYRLSWFIALQAFLFSAFGLSLSAKVAMAVAKLSASSPSDFDEMNNFLTYARFGLSLIGTFSSFFVILGISAAILSMHDLVKGWRSGPYAHALYPQIIGNEHRTFFGIYLGLVPVVALPLSCGAVWLLIGQTIPDFWSVSFDISGAILTLYLVVVFGRYLIRKSTPR